VTDEVVILAAGQGSRMRSRLPKVLHPLAGKPMLAHVTDAAKKLGVDAIHVVIGHGADTVKAAFPNDSIQWALQEQQLGTGHAVAQAMPAVSDDSLVLIAYGDVPLVKAETFARLLQACDQNTLTLLTVELDDPRGYGRIVRDAENNINAIVEQKDADDTQLKIKEVNTGILAAPASKLKQWLPALSSENAQGEYYLTDIIHMAVADEMDVVALHPQTEWEVQGANDREQLAQLERHYQLDQAKALMKAGASLADPRRIDIRGSVSVGQDVFIDVNCVLIGEVTIGNGVHIGPNCVIENSVIGDNSAINANSVLEQAIVDTHCDVGPFARLRPGAKLHHKAKIGNFVEVKKSTIGEGSKVNHLAYVGDAEVGSGSNIGAGTITCNYDGANKYKTTLGKNVFIGSNSTLVAPLDIADDGFVGAGSTVTKNIPSKSLAIARGKQKNIEGWSRPQKTPKDK
jgi:bifunctional UDP-N-acetylglucosamine pyrophosphorylase/glucosamine-1-phosphate N-acetyltransferase